MYGNLNNLTNAIHSKIIVKTIVTKELSVEIAKKDIVIIDSGLRLIESYKKLGINDYDDLMTWIIKINNKD